MAVILIAPVVFALGALFAIFPEAVRGWRSARRWRADQDVEPYVPTRVWVDGRYGDPNADPFRHSDGPETPPVPAVAAGPRHGYRRSR